jgi:hypothetical protein
MEIYNSFSNAKYFRIAHLLPKLYICDYTTAIVVNNETNQTMKPTYLVTALCILSQTLSAQSTFQWVKQIGGIYGDFGSSITFDHSGNLLTTGAFSDIVDFDPDIGVDTLVGNTGPLYSSIFVMKNKASDGSYIWAKSFSGQPGVRNNGQSRDIVSDQDNNIYVLGDFSGSFDFDPSNNTNILQATGISDAFINKLTSQGDFISVITFKGSSITTPEAMAIDSKNNLLTIGSFNGTVDFNPSMIDTFELSTNSNAGGDVFINKLHSSGTFKWATSLPCTDYAVGKSIAIDKNDNIYLAGYYKGTLDLDPGFSTFNVTSNGDYDIFIVKLDSLGNFIWGKTIGGSDNDNCSTIVADQNGSIYISGQYSSTVDFDPGSSNQSITSNGKLDLYVCKLSATGGLNWVYSEGGPYTDVSEKIALDHLGNVYYGGWFGSTIPVTIGSTTTNIENGFLSQIDSTGVLKWIRKTTGERKDFKLHSDGSIFSTGGFFGTSYFNPNTGGYLAMTSNGSYDIFLTKITQPIVSLIEDPLSTSTLIYPNPTTGTFNIKTKENEILSYSLTNENGQVIKGGVVSQSKFTLDLMGKPTGVYILSLKGENWTYRYKIILQ